MEEELRRIEQIVGELLLLAKPPNVQFRKYNLVDTIEQIVALLQTRAIMNNIEIEFQRRAAETEIYCDENQIKQVFINLIQNALEVTPVDGRVAIDIDSDADGVAIAIRDEGPGIPEDKLRKPGEPFFYDEGKRDRPRLDGQLQYHRKSRRPHPSEQHRRSRYDVHDSSAL